MIFDKNNPGEWRVKFYWAAKAAGNVSMGDVKKFWCPGLREEGVIVG